MRIKSIVILGLLILTSLGQSNGNQELSKSHEYVFEQYDQNFNKIEDGLELAKETSDFLVKVNGDFDWPSLGFIERFRTSDKSIVWLQGDIKNIRLLAAQEEVLFIEGVKEIKTHTIYSSKQLGINPQVWDLGYKGDPSMSVAVLDTGIDASHPAFSNKQITWVDFAGISVSIDGDEYLSPVDKDGHGTHVAGIIAGEPIEKVNEGFVGNVPPLNNFQIVKSIRNFDNNIEINYTIDWGNQGIDNPGNYLTIIVTPSNNIGNVVAFSETDTSGYYEGSLTVAPGEYLVGVYNQGNTGSDPEGLPYSISTNIIRDSLEPSTSYNTWSGIAPDVNLVAIKVFDDSGNGNTAILLQGLDWIKNNYMAYNISVVNMSLGTDSISAAIDTEVENLSNLGILVVASAGNNGVNSGGIGSPGSAPYALTVGAVNRMNEISYYSSNGDTNIYSVVKPDIVAPGGSAAIPGLGDTSAYSPGNGLILSAMSSETINLQGNLVTGKQGTSMAAPHVSGVAAILFQVMNDAGELSNTISDVKRIKQIITLSAFEVGNIFNGGEQIEGGVKQNPTIDPITKDFVEGWGAMNPYAAVNLLSETFFENSPVKVEMGLENPFIQNSIANEIMLSAGKTYIFWATIPQGAKVDFVLYDPNPGQYGDPVPLVHQFIDATSQRTTLEVPVTINQSAIYPFSLKLRDSMNQIDKIHFVVLKDYVPFINPIFPYPDTYINQSDVEVKFQSMTNIVEASIDGNYIGQISEGYVIQGLNDGVHVLSLEETNPNTNQKANTTFNFNIDTVIPTMTTNLSSFTTDSRFAIQYSASDNIGIQFVRARAGNVIFDTSMATEGVLTIEPSMIAPGTYELIIEVFDLANNVFRVSTEITLVHDLFIEGKDLIVEEFNTTILLEWNAGSQNPDKYIIYVDGTLKEENNWNGENVQYLLSPSHLGTYNITVIVSTLDSKIAKFTTIITVQDTTAPKILVDSVILFDATYIQDFVFDIEEFFPYSLQVKYNGSTILFIRPWNGSYFFSPIQISGLPKTSAIVSIGIEDTSGNIANKSILIKWEDLTEPIIQPLEDQTLSVGEIKELEWTWEERFVKKIVLSKNAETIFESTDIISSIKFSIGEPISQTVEYKLEIQDQGNHTKIDKMIVKVISSSSEDISGQAFIPISIIPIFATFILIVRKRKIKL